MDEDTGLGITRQEARVLMEEYLQEDTLRKHCLATEAIMGALARKKDQNPELWAIAGLLHDLDYQETKGDMSRHTLRTAEILAERGVSEAIIGAIKGHNAENLGYRRMREIEHALACAESITGMIVAVTLVYPDKKLASVKPKSVLKRMKEKRFASNVSRQCIRECEEVGIPLEEFVELSLQAMRSIHDKLGL